MDNHNYFLLHPETQDELNFIIKTFKNNKPEILGSAFSKNYTIFAPNENTSLIFSNNQASENIVKSILMDQQIKKFSVIKEENIQKFFNIDYALENYNDMTKFFSPRSTEYKNLKIWYEQNSQNYNNDELRKTINESIYNYKFAIQFQDVSKDYFNTESGFNETRECYYSYLTILNNILVEKGPLDPKQLRQYFDQYPKLSHNTCNPKDIIKLLVNTNMVYYDVESDMLSIPDQLPY